VGKERYIMCCDVAQYGGKWRMLELGGFISIVLGIRAGQIGTFPDSSGIG